VTEGQAAGKKSLRRLLSLIRRTTRGVLLSIGIPLMILGVIGFLPIILIMRSFPGVNVPFAPDDVIVTPEGALFCSSGAYGRVQAYDRTGKFMKAWSLPHTSSEVDLAIDAQRRIHVQYFSRADGDMHLVYDLRGSRLEGASKTIYVNAPQQIDQEGNVYEISDRSVVRRTPGGGSTTLISTPFYLLWMSGPGAGWLHAASGALICMIASVLLRKRQRHEKRQAPDGSASETSEHAEDAWDVTTQPEEIRITEWVEAGTRRIVLSEASVGRALALGLMTIAFSVLVVPMTVQEFLIDSPTWALLLFIPPCIACGGVLCVMWARGLTVWAVELRKSKVTLCKRFLPFAEKRTEVALDELKGVALEGGAIFFKTTDGNYRLGRGINKTSLAWVATHLRVWTGKPE
jgi:hypothetical protein